MPPLREQKVRNKKKKHISWSGGKFSRGNGRLQRDGTHTHRKKVGRDEWAKTHISRIRSVYVIKRKKKKGRNNVRSKKKQKWIASHHHHHHRHWHWFAIGNQIYFISHFFFFLKIKTRQLRSIESLGGSCREPIWNGLLVDVWKAPLRRTPRTRHLYTKKTWPRCCQLSPFAMGRLSAGEKEWHRDWQHFFLFSFYVGS